MGHGSAGRRDAVPTLQARNVAGSSVRATLFLITIGLFLVTAPALRADDTLVPAEQVRYDYAQVLNVQPVEQVVTISKVERRCGGPGRAPDQCRDVRVPGELRRIIGYDVDYAYRGAKHRSRVAQDPGRRMRIRIGITPMVSTRVKP